MSEAFLSATQLRNLRKLSQTFPEYKKSKFNDKQSYQSSEDEIKADLDQYLDERQACLSEGKCAKVGQLIRGEYIPEEKAVKVDKLFGQGIQHMGYNFSFQGRMLYPEEAIYLMDCKRLEVYYKNVPLSMIEIYTKLLSSSSHNDKYIVYSHLASLGYMLIRFKNRDLPTTVSKVKPESKVESKSDGHEQNETVQFIGAFSRYDKIDADVKRSLCQPGPCLLIQNPHITFPNINDHLTDKIIPLDHLHPPGASFHSVHEDNSPPAKRKCISSSTSTVNSWYEYKKLLGQTIQMNPLITPNASPLIQPSNATTTADIFKRLRSVFPSNSKVELNEEAGLNLDFDVYLPSSLKNRSARNTRPDHRVVVVSQSDPVPKPTLIKRMMDKLADGIQIHIAIVDGGNVAFYTFNHDNIQPDVLPD